MNRASLLLLASALLGACIDIHPSAPFCDEPTPAKPPTQTPEFHTDVRPVMRRACASCHAEDAIAGFSIDSAQEVIQSAGAIRDALESHRMPPWKPASCCGDYARDGNLEPSERATLLAWLDGGMPVGEELEPPAVPSSGLSRVDLEVLMPEPYIPAPPPGTLDDTRCFLLDWPLDVPATVTGIEILPGDPTLVHHALVLTATPEQSNKLAKLDDDDPGPGWSCPGGIVADFAGYIGGWSPGFEAADFPADLGQQVEPGSKLILTMHYSLHNFGGTDQSTVRLKLADGPTRRRKALAVVNPVWLIGGMPIEKDDPAAVHSYVYDPTLWNGGNPYTLYGINLHMHERGARGLVSILRADGEKECLLQIDDWDYDWQNEYEFAQPIRLGVGDRLYIECEWDNTAANQRVIAGALEPSRDLNWAEDEEMCIAFVTATTD